MEAARLRHGENRLRDHRSDRGERPILVWAGIPYRANREPSRHFAKLLPQEVDVMRDGKVTSPAVEQLVPGDIVLLERCGYNYALKPPTKSFEGVSRPASTQVLGGQMSTDESEVATTPPALSLKERR